MPTDNAHALSYQEEAAKWRMPISPSDYPDRNPLLTQEERKSIEHLLSLEAGQSLEFDRAVALLHRATQPLLDVIALYQQEYPNSLMDRQPFIGHLFRYVLQTNMLYWGWEAEIWKTVIDTAPTLTKEVIPKLTPSSILWKSPYFVLTHLAAYLFADLFYPNSTRGFPAQALGEVIFARERVQTAIDKIMGTWLDRGFTVHRPSQKRFVFATILVLLANRNPYLEMLTLTSLSALYQSDLKPDVRQRVEQLQRALRALQIIASEEGEQRETQPTTRLFEEDFVAGIQPRWVAWLRAFWQQTPISGHNREEIVIQTSIAFRWVSKHYPQVTEPRQWTRELAVRFVAYVCNEATVYDYASPVTKERLAKYLAQRQGEPLRARGKAARIGSLRSFFRCLQKYSYEVEGKVEPRLQITWNPADALATPEHVMRELQPNPRNVEEEAWLKLVWTACTLNAEMIKEVAPGAKMYPLPLWRAVALIWVTGCRRRDEILRLPLECVRREWAPEMVDEHGVQLEPAENLWYLLVPTNKYRGTFWTPIPQYTAEAILAWKALRPKNQPSLPDRKTGKPTEYLFQYREKKLGRSFINEYLIPVLCKAAGLTNEEGKVYKDAVGPITSHRARSSTAYYLKAMGMTPYDIGKLLGHTNPNQTLPWYLKENLHQLGRMYRKANPLDRTVQALLDTNAAAKGEPCVFYYLSDSPEGRPRLCGNPNFRTCYHQLKCAECGAYLDTEMAEVIERQPGCLQISVSIPLPEQLVEDLSKQEEGIPTGEPPPPPPIPSPAFHFNKKVVACIEEPGDQTVSELDHLCTRLVELEGQLTAKGKQDARNVSIRLLKKEISDLKKRIVQLEQGDEANG